VSAAAVAIAADTWLRSTCGRVIPVESARWWEAPGPEEDEVLARVLPHALDIGCGPARHTLALAERGVAATGIDISAAVVRAARARGARVLHRDVFGPVPDVGTWGSALLLDGNVGIGGDPARLLTRVRDLLRPGGLLLVETAPPGAGTASLRVRAETHRRRSGWFAWAIVDADDLPALGQVAGLPCVDRWSAGDRWFGRLERP
jgi:SAM-dependent methyltransferase